MPYLLEVSGLSYEKNIGLLFKLNLATVIF